MKKSNIFTIIVLIIVIVLLATIGYGYYKKATMEVKNPIVTMEVENYGTIKLELYPEIAPETVSNFVNLVQNKYYDNMTFHRVIDGFMIQGGGNRIVENDVTNEETGETTKEISTESVSPKLSDLGIKLKDGQEDEEYCIKGEFLLNGYEKNTLKHEEGVISMARADYTQSYSSTLTTESYNSASAQFFIMTETNSSLDRNYAPFGRVIEGMDVVHKIEKVEVKAEETTNGEDNSDAEKSVPVENVVIKSVTVDTQGVEYEKPHTLEPWDYYTWITETYGINLGQ